MNLLHLRYAVETEKYHSINKAAEQLFTSQPNISRAIKELEKSFDIQIFSRTHLGMVPTRQGEKFLRHAKKILAEVDSVKEIFEKKHYENKKLLISAVSCDFISNAFVNFVEKSDFSTPFDINLKETAAENVFQDIKSPDHSLGFGICKDVDEGKCQSQAEQSGLVFKVIKSFDLMVIFSNKNSLEKKANLNRDDLKEFTFITSKENDFYCKNRSKENENFVFVSSRLVKYHMLDKVANCYTFSPPLEEETLKRHNLAQKKIDFLEGKYFYFLIYKKNIPLSDLENDFMTELLKK